MNIVQRRKVVNTLDIIDTKTHILNVAENLALVVGINNITMRMIAEKAEISLGSIYNYYTNKGEIICDIIENFWKDAFSNINLSHIHSLDFLSALETIYYELSNFLHTFKQNWLEQLYLLPAKDRISSKKKEEEYLFKIHTFIKRSLSNYENIQRNYTSTEIEKLSKFIFDNMIIILKSDYDDFPLFKKVLTKILY